VKIGDKDYGYRPNGDWCEVAVPINALLAINPKLDLSMVLSRFIIADIFSETKKDATTSMVNNLPFLDLDAIHFAK
jgi:hypothetical protein